MLFHEEERATTALLEAYQHENPDTILAMTFENGASFRCMFVTSFEDENDEEIDSPLYDEYYTLIYEIVETLSSPEVSCDAVYNEFLNINYKRFPIRVTDDLGTVIYQK